MANTHDKPSVILGWKMMLLVVLVMIGSIGLALLLIPPLSLNAAIRGGSIAIGMFLAQQIGLRWYARRKRRGRD
jgi:hypothetical protein